MQSIVETIIGHRKPESIREIERINRLALAAGMSYGKYVAMSYQPPTKKTKGRKHR